MADDIVERLRVIHCAADDLTPCGTCLTCRAADEIERLRIAGDAMAEFIGRRAGSSDKSHIRDEADEVCLLWEDAVKGGEFWEARRG